MAAGGQRSNAADRIVDSLAVSIFGVYRLQNSSLREVHDFMSIAALREGGYFNLRIENDEALDEFNLDYPNMEAALVEDSRTGFKKVGLDGLAPGNLP